MGNDNTKDDGDGFKRDETLGEQIRRDMHDNDAKFDKNQEEKPNKSKELSKKITKKILKTKLPVWLLVIAFICFSFFRLYVYFTQVSPVNLRPAVENAVNVKIIITSCRDELDSKNIKVRDEEKRIENALKKDEKVLDASVTIERIDCTK